MELTPVKSSRIAAYGYLEADQVLLVRYRDGALYAYLGVPPTRFYDFEGTQSKGGWLGYCKEFSSVRINPIESPKTERVARESGPLNVIDEDADKCCIARLHVHIETPRTDDFECPDCGTRFHLDALDTTTHGGGRPGIYYWRIVPQVSIVRPR